jgi:hypothetical protein
MSIAGRPRAWRGLLSDGAASIAANGLLEHSLQNTMLN